MLYTVIGAWPVVAGIIFARLSGVRTATLTSQRKAAIASCMELVKRVVGFFATLAVQPVMLNIISGAAARTAFAPHSAAASPNNPAMTDSARLSAMNARTIWARPAIQYLLP